MTTCFDHHDGSHYFGNHTIGSWTKEQLGDFVRELITRKLETITAEKSKRDSKIVKPV